MGVEDPNMSIESPIQGEGEGEEEARKEDDIGEAGREGGELGGSEGGIEGKGVKELGEEEKRTADVEGVAGAGEEGSGREGGGGKFLKYVRSPHQ